MKGDKKRLCEMGKSFCVTAEQLYEALYLRRKDSQRVKTRLCYRATNGAGKRMEKE